MAGLQVREVAPQEVAYFVLRYLQEHNFPISSKAFAAEAEDLLRLVQTPPPYQQVKSLPAVLNEYVALEARARRRAEFERAFGDDAGVRDCLGKLGSIMDDYLVAVARGGGSSSAAGGSTLTKGEHAQRSFQPRIAHADASTSEAEPRSARGTSASHPHFPTSSSAALQLQHRTAQSIGLGCRARASDQPEAQERAAAAPAARSRGAGYGARLAPSSGRPFPLP